MPNIHEPGPEQIFSIFLKGTLVYLHMCCLSCIYHRCTSNLNYWICIDWIFLCLLFKLLAVFKKMLSKAHCEKDFNIKHNFFFIQTKGQETKAKESELDIWVCLKCRCQSMRILVCRRSMSGKTCLRLVELLGLPVTMTGNFCKILLYIQWCDR